MARSFRVRMENFTPPKKEPPRQPEREPLYGDVAVCRALRIRRRVLAAARTAEGRGRDWDCVGEHAGMTKSWVTKKALELHVVPDFAALKPIEAGDGVVSCVLSAVVPNIHRAIVDVLADGRRAIVWVPDSTQMLMREAFDCFDDHGTVSWRKDLNDVAY